MVYTKVQVVVVGLGTVGQALLDLLHHFASEFEVIAIVNSTHLWTEPLHIQSLLKDPFLKNSKDPSFLLGQPYQLDFLSALPTSTLPKVILDCTASSTLPNHYPTWLNSGYFIVTANKKGLAGPIGLYDACSPFISSTFYYESTVGAGLPIIATLIDLIQSHDKIYRIEGVLSGSLSFLFNQDLKKTKFSECVLQAKKLGFTEPDPREDLNGMDVVRKLVILARTAHWELNDSEVSVLSLIPKALETLPLNSFLHQIKEMDEFLIPLLNASEESKTRYVGSLDFNTRKASVGLKDYPTSHPFCNLTSSDNGVQFITQRFPRGLYIQGAGAGGEVTAFGMISDLLKIYRRFL